MAQCITDVMNSKANLSVNARNRAIDGGYAEAMARYAQQNMGKDTKTCSEKLYDWIQETMGFNVYSATANISPYTLFDKPFTLFDVNESLKLPELTLPKQICKLLTGWMTFLQANIEVISKLAFALFAQIDKQRQAIEAFVTDSLNKVFSCLENILADVKARLSKIGVNGDFGLTGKINLNIDISTLYPVLVDCPCFCKAMAHILNCNKDSDGNDISYDADKVYACMNNKVNSINFGGTLDSSFSFTLGDLICSNLESLYNMIMAAMHMVLDLLMLPFRALIKAYADLLTKKFDVTAFIKLLGNMDCFFIYTVETKEGIDFYGMSIIDMINTLKGWTTCFKNLCPSITADIEAKIKEINEKFRFSESFWSGALEADLYDMCIAAKLGYKRLTAAEFKEIYDDNPKNTFTNFISKLNTTGIKESVQSYKKRNKYRSNELTDIQASIKYRTAPDCENTVNTGDKEIEVQDERLCISSSESLTGKTSSPFFIEKFYQLLRMLSQYAMDKDTVYKLEDLLDKCNGKKSDTNMNVKYNPFPADTGIRKENLGYPEQKTVTYHIEDDYDEDEINAILGATA